MTNQEAIEKFKKIKRGNIFLIHQRCEGKEVIEDYSLCDMAISALQAQDLQQSYNNIATDCISRKAAIDALDEEPYVWNDTPEELAVWNMWHRHKDALMSLSSTQSEIIRCKDCKHRMPYWGNCKLLEEKYHQSVLVAENDFCSQAERRTDGA